MCVLEFLCFQGPLEVFGFGHGFDEQLLIFIMSLLGLITFRTE